MTALDDCHVHMSIDHVVHSVKMKSWVESRKVLQKSFLGCNIGMGKSAVLQPWVSQVWVWFQNSGPETILWPITSFMGFCSVRSIVGSQSHRPQIGLLGSCILIWLDTLHSPVTFTSLVLLQQLKVRFPVAHSLFDHWLISAFMIASKSSVTT